MEKSKQDSVTPGNVYDLSGSTPDIQVPDEVKRSSCDALQKKQTHYAAVPGIEPLRKAVSTFLVTLDCVVTPDQVVITAGKQETYFVSLQGISRQFSDLEARGYRDARNLATFNSVRDNPKIVIPEVCHPGVRLALAVRSRHTIEIPVDAALGFSPNLNAIEEALSQGYNLIYLESPNQLTGFCYSAAQVEEIGKLLVKYDALAVWDQGMAPYVLKDYVSLHKFTPQRTIIIGELWPGLGISTWQIGYVAAPREYVEGLTAIKQVISICTNTPSQWGYLGGADAFTDVHPRLLKEISDFKDEILTTYPSEKRIIAGQVESILAINFGAGVDQAINLLEQENIHITDGKDFNAPGIIRIAMKPDALTVKVINDLLEGVKI